MARAYLDVRRCHEQGQASRHAAGVTVVRWFWRAVHRPGESAWQQCWRTVVRALGLAGQVGLSPRTAERSSGVRLWSSGVDADLSACRVSPSRAARNFSWPGTVASRLSARAISPSRSWARSRKFRDVLASISTGATASTIIVYVRNSSYAMSRSPEPARNWDTARDAVLA